MQTNRRDYVQRLSLLKDLPIDDSHGCLKGREFISTAVSYQAAKSGGGDGRFDRVFFIGDAGEECAAFAGEFEWMEPEES